MTPLNAIAQFVSGAITMGYLVVALFFLKFWKRSRDRLFAWFALSFFLLAGQRCALALTTQTSEGNIFLYLARLVAFLFIAIAIVDKNRMIFGQGLRHRDDELPID